MKIVHTCLRYPPATGGVETYVHELVERTRNIDENRDVRVLTSSMRTHGPITALDPDLLAADPMHVQRLHHASTPFISYPRLQALNYYIGHHKPDILHGYSFWYQPADVAARYARANNIPFILHPMYYENDIRNKPIWQFYKRTIGRKTFAAADVVVVISPYEQSLIEKAGFSVKKFELIPPGVDATRFTVQRPNPFTFIPSGEPILLAVSRLATGKGLEDLVSAMPQVIKDTSSAHLVIIGEDFGAQQQLQEQVASKGLGNNIYFMGKVSDEILAAAYQHATVFVHPSHYEAFGIVLAEALAAGTPVIARNVAAIPYVVPNHKAGLLFSSQDELVQHICTLLKDDGIRKQYGSYGKQYVQNHFSWDVSIKKLTGLYESLISGSHNT